MRESASQIPSPFIHSCDAWKNVVRGAWYLHPRAINPNADKGARSPLVSQLGSTNWYPEEARRSTDVRVVHGSRVGSGTIAVIAATAMMPTVS
jgi:hypothetical protein